MPVLKRTLAYTKRKVRFAPNFSHERPCKNLLKADVDGLERHGLVFAGRETNGFPATCREQ